MTAAIPFQMLLILQELSCVMQTRNSNESDYNIGFPESAFKEAICVRALLFFYVHPFFHRTNR